MKLSDIGLRCRREDGRKSEERGQEESERGGPNLGELTGLHGSNASQDKVHGEGKGGRTAGPP
jgi:hypothetical protein